MHAPTKRFVPAAGHDLLLPFYDPLNRLLRAGRAKRQLVEAAAIRPGDRVLDLGSGTGDVAIAVKLQCPEARVHAFDPDPKALARARRKAARAGVEIAFEQGFAGKLPHPDASFERVVSSLVLHHLTSDEKRAALAEVARVLVPGGTLHVLDFGPPRNRLQSALAHLFHHDERMAENRAGLLPRRMQEAGLADVRERARPRALLGALALYEARRPG